MMRLDFFQIHLTRWLFQLNMQGLSLCIMRIISRKKVNERFEKRVTRKMDEVQKLKVQQDGIIFNIAF